MLSFSSSIPTLRVAPQRARSLQARSAAASSSRENSGPSGGLRPAAQALSEKDLGARISVLYRIHGDPEHPYSEVVGVLQRIERKTGSAAGLMQVIRRDGRVVAVATDDVVTFKVLDGRPVRET